MGADLEGHFDFHTQGSSAIGTITLPGMQVRITVIGGDGYERIGRGHDAGWWLKYPLQPFKQFTLAGFASNPFSGYGPLSRRSSRQRVNSRKVVVVVSWRNGSKVQVANTGSAYPLRADFKGGTRLGGVQRVQRPA